MIPDMEIAVKRVVQHEYGETGKRTENQQRAIF
jgi:hypothetical protein